MKIRIKTPKAVELETLSMGDVFEYNDMIFITTNEINYDREDWRVVRLTNGEIYTFEFSLMVFKLDTLLTLRRIGEEE